MGCQTTSVLMTQGVDPYETVFRSPAEDGCMNLFSRTQIMQKLFFMEYVISDNRGSWR
jgi:hypothetical protein